jgi:hypothetical protein
MIFGIGSTNMAAALSWVVSDADRGVTHVRRLRRHTSRSVDLLDATVPMNKWREQGTGRRQTTRVRSRSRNWEFATDTIVQCGVADVRRAFGSRLTSHQIGRCVVEPFTRTK